MSKPRSVEMYVTVSRNPTGNCYLQLRDKSGKIIDRQLICRLTKSGKVRRLRRPRVAKHFNAKSYRRFYPDDKLFDLVREIPKYVGKWGGRK